VDLTNFAPEDLALWRSREPLWVNDMTDRYPAIGPNTIGRLCGSIQFYTGNGSNAVSHHVGIVFTPKY
jgi:hypothetical protein